MPAAQASLGLLTLHVAQLKILTPISPVHLLPSPVSKLESVVPQYLYYSTDVPVWMSFNYQDV